MFGRERQEQKEDTRFIVNGLPWIPMNAGRGGVSPAAKYHRCERCERWVLQEAAAFNLHGLPWNSMDASAFPAMCHSCCHELQMKFHNKMLQSWKSSATHFAPGGDLSLKKMTQLCILKNKQFFVHLSNQQPKINPFLRISNTMKKELTKLDEAEMEATENHGEGILQCQVLQLMLNQTITTFSFPPGLKSGKTDAAVTELWQSLLAEKPADLHTIISRFTFKSGSWDKRPFFTSLLPVFPNLEVLRLEQFECHDADLITIAEHLPKLRVLEVKMSDKVSWRGICTLMQLSSLQEFYFDNWREKTFLEHLIGMCFKYLPHLHAVAFKEAQTSVHHKLSVQMGNALWKVRSGCTLQLRQLAVPKLYYLYENVSLPELQVLCVHQSLGAAQREMPASCFTFPNLTKLIILDVSYKNLRFVLSLWGHQLQTLRYAIRDRKEWHIFYALGKCPNLSELDVCACSAQSLMPGFWNEFEEHDNVQYSLSTLKMSFLEKSYFETGSLAMFLQLMPELRHFQLKDVELRVKDLEEVAELAEQGKLQHLQHINLEFCHMFIDDVCSINEAIFNWITHCPQLKRFQLSITCLNKKRSDHDSRFYGDY